MRLLLCLLLFCQPLYALVITSDDVQKELAAAQLVANITVTSWNSASDRIQFATFKAEATVDEIISNPTGNPSFPVAGDAITIEGLGGEIDGVGVVIPGYPRPLVGHHYRAYLNQNANSNYVVTGVEYGLVDLQSDHLYTRNRTDGSNGNGVGPFLFWARNFMPIPYFISAPSFTGHPDYVAAVDQSFKTWRDIQDITIEFLPLGCTTKTIDQNDGINTVIYVADNWQFDPQVIALTRNFYVAGNSPEPGLILTTDILINGANHPFSTTGDPNAFDIQDIVTHEAGHFQGLGHDTVPPVDPDATMFATATPGETKKRTLHPDDLAGIHAAYAGVGQKLSAFNFPSCVIPSSNVGCAAVHQPGGRGAQDLVWVVLFLMGVMVTARLFFRIRGGQS